MSFILDALKKSEESRQQGQSAATRKHVLALQGQHRRRWPPWLALAALLPAALLAGWWLGKGPSPSDPMIAQPPAQQTEATGPPPADRASRTLPTSSAAPAKDPERQMGLTQQPTAQAPPARQFATGSQAAAPVPRQPASIEPAPIPTRRPAAAASPESATAPAAASRQPLPGQVQSQSEAIPSPTAYTDLSQELRSRLPQLEVSLHFYSSDPARRMVRIDGRLLHEGEAVAEGLTVHEITPEKTIIDYHGRLFSLEGPGG